MRDRKSIQENILVESLLNFRLTCISLNSKNLVKMHMKKRVKDKVNGTSKKKTKSK